MGQQERALGSHAAPGCSRLSSLPPTTPVEGVGRVTLIVVACALLFAAVVAIRSLIAPLLLGACVAALVRPLAARFAPVVGPRRAAAATTAFVVLAVALPLTLVTIPVVAEVRALVASIRAGKLGSLQLSLEAAAPIAGSPREVAHALGQRLAESLPGLVGIAGELALGVFVFLMSLYYTLVDGERAMAFARRISPLASQHLDALVREFVLVGRAVLVSVALTALVEGGVAGIAYFALGLPSAALLTVLTAIAALIPIGTVLVWGPLAAVLWSQGRTFAALVILLTGAVVISGIDHLARPHLTRIARSRLHPLLVLVGMFGGMASLGGWGLFAGPLVVALCVAALRLYDREQRARLATELALSSGAVAHGPVAVSGVTEDAASPAASAGG